MKKKKSTREGCRSPPEVPPLLQNNAQSNDNLQPRAKIKKKKILFMQLQKKKKKRGCKGKLSHPLPATFSLQLEIKKGQAEVQLTVAHPDAAPRWAGTRGNRGPQPEEREKRREAGVTGHAGPALPSLWEAGAERKAGRGAAAALPRASSAPRRTAYPGKDQQPPRARPAAGPRSRDRSGGGTGYRGRLKAAGGERGGRAGGGACGSRGLRVT